MNAKVKSLHEELLELEANRPEMPRGLPSEHPEFIRWHQSFQTHVDRKQILLAKITALMHPVEVAVRQERPLTALLKRPPARLRR